MNCWEILGLDAGADERTIKRHYARLLKTTRPDEDPVAFQALREAYEQALRLAQWRTDAEGEAVEALVAAAETADVAQAVQPLTESAVPVAAIDHRPRQLAELLTELRPSLLTERRLQAEAAGVAVEFERGVLRLCLKEEWESILRDAACAEYGWLEVRETRSLKAAELLPLYEQILQSYLLQMRALHNRSEPLELVDGLKSLLNQPWLQSYDGRALLEGSVVSMLLEMPYWSCATLDAIAEVFGWREGSREASCPEHQWRALLERWDAERFYSRISADAQCWELTPECRAARLVLAPWDRFQRRRFSRDFAKEEQESSRDVAASLVHRYPQLLPRLPGAPLDETFWRDLARSGPILTRVKLLWIGFILMYGLVYSLEPRKFDPALLVGIPLISTILAVGLDKLLVLYDLTLRHDLKKLDYRLSGYLPPGWHQYGAGIRPLRHGVPAIGGGLLIAHACDLQGAGFWLASLVLASALLLLIHLALRTQLLARGAELILDPVRRHSRVLLAVASVAILLGVIGIYVHRQQQLIDKQNPVGRQEKQHCLAPEHSRELACALSQ
ncbi:J domain-containing protein [Pseudomonas sp. ZM23]|uniref:J domain-containing protein n=1 Tax=Pseudomonas triclosanedens TaxID=2961893 RepID=A0ABY7A103_9PSED|nr:J domain-containing protein [Pseudomonas triclosanedens]MCP8463911.1 J domain-containing protein [Pseudomonas triclosanedens]MCP8468995.1 J domain-containing protein [Pseudomonas triclosanedens]MCP8475717.1 J domain-containing protein [Pseudomonas triclosanedens]WAI50570.1 J domain-containing protein [Pseudomonas triclosanedens]